MWPFSTRHQRIFAPCLISAPPLLLALTEAWRGAEIRIRLAANGYVVLPGPNIINIMFHCKFNNHYIIYTLNSVVVGNSLKWLSGHYSNFKSRLTAKLDGSCRTCKLTLNLTWNKVDPLEAAPFLGGYSPNLSKRRMTRCHDYKKNSANSLLDLERFLFRLLDGHP